MYELTYTQLGPYAQYIDGKWPKLIVGAKSSHRRWKVMAVSLVLVWEFGRSQRILSVAAASATFIYVNCNLPAWLLELAVVVIVATPSLTNLNLLRRNYWRALKTLQHFHS